MFKGLMGLFLLFNTGTTPVEIESYAFNEAELLQVHPVPSRQEPALAPVIEAKASLIMDLNTGVLLYDENAYDSLPMASLTKIMTAVLILESHEMNEIVEVDRNFGYLEGVKIGLTQGEKLTVKDLLKALLIRSGGDAAVALAVHHSGSVEAFVEEMNQRAISLGLKNTVFENPVGLDAPEHLSTAFELALLTRHALQFEDFREIVQMSSATIVSLAGNNYNFASTNYLLDGYLDILGVKTGTTPAAGECLIALVRDSQDNQVLAVVLNSPDRFSEMTSMLDWTLRSYRW